jgi:hypothetical protein
MAHAVQKLCQRLTEEGERSHVFFCNLKEPQLVTEIYSEGTHWNALQVLTHFVATEIAFRILIQDILKGGKGAPENFDIDAYNEEKVVQFTSFRREQLLERYLDERNENVLLVSQLSEEDLNKQGRHPFLGITTIEEIVKLLYRHNQIHVRDIRRVLIESDPGALT